MGFKSDQDHQNWNVRVIREGLTEMFASNALR